MGGSVANWKRRWFVLYDTKLAYYSSEKPNAEPKVEIRLKDILSLSIVRGKDGHEYCFGICTKTQNERIFYVHAEDERDMSQWLLLIDATKSQGFESALLLPGDRKALLDFRFKANYKGGTIKSNNLEEWSYTPAGELRAINGVGVNIVYFWDGETLNSLNFDYSFGIGKWNGSKLAWYKGNYGPDKTPFWECQWDQLSRTFNHIARPWKFIQASTKLCLTDGNGNEWVIDGDIPEPVVIFLQMIRYARFGGS